MLMSVGRCILALFTQTASGPTGAGSLEALKLCVLARTQNIAGVQELCALLAQFLDLCALLYTATSRMGFRNLSFFLRFQFLSLRPGFGRGYSG